MDKQQKVTVNMVKTPKIIRIFQNQLHGSKYYIENCKEVFSHINSKPSMHIEHDQAIETGIMTPGFFSTMHHDGMYDWSSDLCNTTKNFDADVDHQQDDLTHLCDAQQKAAWHCYPVPEGIMKARQLKKLFHTIKSQQKTAMIIDGHAPIDTDAWSIALGIGMDETRMHGMMQCFDQCPTMTQIMISKKAIQDAFTKITRTTHGDSQQTSSGIKGVAEKFSHTWKSLQKKDYSHHENSMRVLLMQEWSKADIIIVNAQLLKNKSFVSFIADYMTTNIQVKPIMIVSGVAVKKEETAKRVSPRKNLKNIQLF